ncbi:ParB/RepB/Spo0J family partition protein [Methylibium sp.]|uniref:ParB/RepB/Spo0J family partition protein n=1 Tax=Methylibium sp. TaxID=2067992 RepID=UPI003D09E7B5
MTATEDPSTIPREAIEGAVHIPLALIKPSTTPAQVLRRSLFNPEEMKRMVTSVMKHGVMQPIVVRAIEGAKTGEPLYEIAAGERRWLASDQAGLPTIPALLRTLTNVELLELQLTENMHRENPHPLVEAEGFRGLLRAPDGADGYTNAEELADHIGKSRRYVFNRLKLLDLVPAGRDALLADKISATVALLIARLQQADQPEALKICVHGWAGEPYSARQAGAELERRFMLQLSKAPFKITDASLVPAAGSCRECPKRTGANPDLFDDIKSADTCTDSKCFNLKTDTHRERVLEEGRAQGLEVITGAAAKKVKPHSHSSMAGYLPLDEVHHSIDGSKPLGKLLGKDAPAVALLEDPHTHEVRKVVRTEDAMKVLRDKGIVKTSKLPTTSASQRKAEAQAKASTAWRTAAVERAMERTLALSADDAFSFGSFIWAEIALVMWNRLSGDDERRCEKLLGWEHIASPWQDPKADSKTEARIRALTPAELGRLLVCLCLVGEVHVGPNATAKGLAEAPRIARFTQQLGVDIAQIRKDLAAGASTPGGRGKAKSKTAPAASPPDATQVFVAAHASKSDETAKAAKPKPSRKTKAAAQRPKYVHPATGATWSGRGLQPAWVKAWLGNGRRLVELEAEGEDDDDAGDAPVVNPKAVKVAGGGSINPQAVAA